MSTAVVFYGNCQAQALAEIYRRHIAPLRDEIVSLVLIGSGDTGLLTQADVIVEQIFDSQPRIEPSMVRSDAKWFRFPLVIGTFLWPFASQDHVQNERHTFLPSGPYPSELGDSFLNRLIGQVSPEEAFARYKDLDVAAHAHLDRLYEINMSTQDQRDKLSGIGVASLIEQYYRSEPLFLTRGHPRKRLFHHVAKNLFGKIGIPDDQVRLAINGYHHSVFPWDEFPIHPSVARHYSLEYVTPDSRYRHMEEGRFTFEQYVWRYLRYEWNPELHEGIHLAGGQAPRTALALLELGLAKSPQSDLGLRVLGELHLRLGNLAEAHDAANRALTVDSLNPENLWLLGSVLTQIGDLGGAEEALRAALEVHPLGDKFHRSLADVLSRTGRHRDAADVVASALPLMPGDPHAYFLLGLMLHRSSDLNGAEEAFRRAIALAPDFEGFHSALADLLEHKRRNDAAD